MDFVRDLNEEQLRAVTSTSKYCSIVAGAGSGKTRVLTYRIAYLIDEMGVDPATILGITFTNKAAKEIKERVYRMLPGLDTIQLSTIHSFCARFLRKYINTLGVFSNNFSIIDETDRKTMIKNIFVSLGYEKKDERIKSAVSFISSKKGEGYTSQTCPIKAYNYDVKLYLQVFSLYEERLIKTNCLDFDDLILQTIKVLENDNTSIRYYINRQIKHILVDEFQDIDPVQFRLITLLMNQDTTLYVVGDPDQTIYTWRGADYSIMLYLQDNLSKIYGNVSVEEIVLKNNYRSTKRILDAGNTLIKNNQKRIKKDLLATKDEGEPIMIHQSDTRDNEARYVAETILNLNKQYGVNYDDIAVLYRSNYLSSSLEKRMKDYSIPYQIIGGISFFQRKEIKDLTAYFNLFVNPYSDVSLERIINVPRRNIGPITLEKLQKLASDEGQTLYFYIKESLNASSDIPPQKVKALKRMVEQIDNTSYLIKNAKSIEYGDIIKNFIQEIDFYSSIPNDEEKASKIENVEEVVGDIKRYFNENKKNTFLNYVENLALLSVNDTETSKDRVSLMTVHAAKGLEFDYVFIYGFNQGDFPSNRALIESKEGDEEERRLAYVAITRAKKKLFMTYALDYNFRSGGDGVPSQFIKEAGLSLPKRTHIQFIDKMIASLQNESPEPKRSFKNEITSGKIINTTNGIKEFYKGDKILHETFGIGTVIEVISDKIIKVSFENKEFGIKTLLSSNVKISKIVS